MHDVLQKGAVSRTFGTANAPCDVYARVRILLIELQLHCSRRGHLCQYTTIILTIIPCYFILRAAFFTASRSFSAIVFEWISAA